MKMMKKFGFVMFVALLAMVTFANGAFASYNGTKGYYVGGTKEGDLTISDNGGSTIYVSVEPRQGGHYEYYADVAIQRYVGGSYWSTVERKGGWVYVESSPYQYKAFHPAFYNYANKGTPIRVVLTLRSGGASGPAVSTTYSSSWTK